MARPTRAVAESARAREHAAMVKMLIATCRYLAHPSVLSELPICQDPHVRQLASTSPPRLFRCARLVIEAIRTAHDEALAELADTQDAQPLAALADALAGLSRAESAVRLGVCDAEVSRRRRDAIEIIADRVAELLTVY